MKTSITICCLLMGACAGPSTEPAPPEQDPAEASVAPEAPALPPAWEGAQELKSTAGRWTVRWTSTPTPIPENEPFSLSVWVLDDAGVPARVELSVDAAMPEHGHGMNRVPRVERNDSGGFIADGLLFHMPGRWELYFDVTRGPLTERAQLEVELE